jgi:hypothetical protein
MSMTRITLHVIAANRLEGDGRLSDHLSAIHRAKHRNVPILRRTTHQKLLNQSPSMLGPKCPLEIIEAVLAEDHTSQRE